MDRAELGAPHPWRALPGDTRAARAASRAKSLFLNARPPPSIRSPFTID